MRTSLPAFVRNSYVAQRKSDFIVRLGSYVCVYIRGLLEKYPTFGREKETGLLGALDT